MDTTSHSHLPCRSSTVICSPKCALYRSRCSPNASAITSSISTAILFTRSTPVPGALKRSYNRRCDALHRHRLLLRSIPSRVVVQQPPTTLARHHRLVIPTVAQIVPLLRPQHHLAGHALLIKRLGHRRPLGLRNPVIHRERVLADLRPQRRALLLDPGQRSLIRRNRLRRPRPLSLKNRLVRGHRLIRQRLLRLQTLAPLHALELRVLQPAHLRLSKPDLMLERRHLHRRRRLIQLLAHLRNLRLEILHIQLLPPPQNLFLRNQIHHDSPLPQRSLGLRLQRRHMLRQRRHLIPQTLRLHIKPLQHNQLLKILMHRNPSLPRHQRNRRATSGEIEVYHSGHPLRRATADPHLPSTLSSPRNPGPTHPRQLRTEAHWRIMGSRIKTLIVYLPGDRKRRLLHSPSTAFS